MSTQEPQVTVELVQRNRARIDGMENALYAVRIMTTCATVVLILFALATSFEMKSVEERLEALEAQTQGETTCR